MRVEVHVAAPVSVPAVRVQLGEVPATPDTAKATKPVGVVALVVDASVTVTMQVEPCPTTTGLVQFTVVLVGSSKTGTVTLIVVGVVVAPISEPVTSTL